MVCSQYRDLRDNQDRYRVVRNGYLPEREIQTDLVKANEVLGGHTCINAGIQLKNLQLGTVEEVRKETFKSIEILGQDYGFIMCCNTILNEAKPKLLKAWINTTREFGVYN